MSSTNAPAAPVKLNQAQKKVLASELGLTVSDLIASAKQYSVDLHTLYTMDAPARLIALNIAATTTEAPVDTITTEAPAVITTDSAPAAAPSTLLLPDGTTVSADESTPVSTPAADDLKPGTGDLLLALQESGALNKPAFDTSIGAIMSAVVPVSKAVGLHSAIKDVIVTLMDANPAQIVKTDLEILLAMPNMTPELIAMLGGIESETCQNMVAGWKSRNKIAAPEVWENLRPMALAACELNTMAHALRLHVNAGLRESGFEIRYDNGFKVLPVSTNKAAPAATPKVKATPAAAATSESTANTRSVINLEGMIDASNHESGCAIVSTMYEGRYAYALVNARGIVIPCDNVGSHDNPDLEKNGADSISPDRGANTGLASWSRSFRIAVAAELGKKVSQDSVVKQVKIWIDSTAKWMRIVDAQDEGFLG